MIQKSDGPGGGSATLPFRAQNITSSRSMDVDYEGELSAGHVARSLASRFGLPTEVDWQLRDEDTAAFLREDDPIREQLVPDATVTLTPRIHLGGCVPEVG